MVIKGLLLGMFTIIFLTGCARAAVKELDLGVAIVQSVVLVLSFCGIMILL